MFIFGAGTLIATPLFDANGNAYTTSNPATPVRLGTLQDVQGGFKFEEKKLYGASQYPVAIGRGKATMDFTAKTGSFDPAVLGGLLLGKSATAGGRFAALDVPVTPSSTTFAVVTGTNNTFAKDLGVRYQGSGVAFTRVSGTPTLAATYSVDESTGTYTFIAADEVPLYISYEYTSTATGAQQFIINSQLMGSSPFFSALLTTSFQGKTMALKLNMCTSTELTLPLKNDDYSVSDFKFSAAADSGGNVGILSMQ